MRTINVPSEEDMKNEVAKQINLDMRIVFKQLENLRNRLERMEDEVSAIYSKVNLLNIIEIPKTTESPNKNEAGIMPLEEKK